MMKTKGCFAIRSLRTLRRNNLFLFSDFENGREPFEKSSSRSSAFYVPLASIRQGETENLAGVMPVERRKTVPKYLASQKPVFSAISDNE